MTDDFDDFVVDANGRNGYDVEINGSDVSTRLACKYTRIREKFYLDHEYR